MKNKFWILSILLIFILNIQQTVAQVVATFDEAEGTLTIENFPNRPFLIFSNHITKNGLLQTGKFHFSPEEMEIRFCGVNLSKDYEEIKGKKVFSGLKDAPQTFVFYYFETDSLIHIKARDIREINVEKNVAAKKEEVPPTINKTTPSAKETKSKEKEKIIINPFTDKVDIFIAKNRQLNPEKKELNLPDREILKSIKLEASQLKKEIENYLDSLWTLKNSKTKCEDCDVLIKSSNNLCSHLEKLISRIVNRLKTVSDKEVVELKTEFWHLILNPFVSEDSLTLSEIKKDIDVRSQNSLFGWIGMDGVKNRLKSVEEHYNKIHIESKIFILHKQEDYEDENDKAVIEELVNEIPDFYKDIFLYNEMLLRIKIPVAKLATLGVLFLLSMVGIIFYLRTIRKNRKLKRNVQQKKNAPESGLLLVDEDDDIEVKTFTVNMFNIKERAGIDYLEINMSDIVNDSTIRNIYLSRGAIVNIYQFFTDFLKYNSRTNETGCFLVGRWEFVPDSNQQLYDISIEKLVEPGDDAIYSEYNLNFGAKIGITLNFVIDNLCEKTGYEYVHTAWMHTHPGFGLFLSNQDLSVQSQLAYSQHAGRLLAIVLDSNTPDLNMAFFTPQKNGNMNNDKNLKKTLSLEEFYKWANK